MRLMRLTAMTGMTPGDIVNINIWPPTDETVIHDKLNIQPQRLRLKIAISIGSDSF
jgi:peptidyl-tRNA hydrolase